MQATAKARRDRKASNGKAKNGKAATSAAAGPNGKEMPTESAPAADPNSPSVRTPPAKPAEPQPSPEAAQAYSVVSQALDRANQRGAFTLDQSANVAQALTVLWHSLPRK